MQIEKSKMIGLDTRQENSTDPSWHLCLLRSAVYSLSWPKAENYR